MIDPQMERGDLLAERFGAERPPLICFLLDESGQDIIEYGLAAFLLSLCAVAALQRSLQQGRLALGRPCHQL